MISYFASVCVASIEAISAFSIPHGNDVHLPCVFGKGRLYIVPEGYFLHTKVGLMVWSPTICICAGICGRAMRRDWWSSILGREET